jgi:murein DD-endopeptidase MepM/ murein hydrolase activator NlpD
MVGESRMKRVLIVLAAASLILAASLTGVITVVGDKLLLYVHIARLYSKDPPQRIAMPLPGVTKNQIANTWQAPRGNKRLHEGQDIFAPRGTPVYAAAPGYVFNIGENRLGGQTVSVIGAGGRVYYYAHLDSYAPGLAEGEYVTTQTKLGSVGTTGNAQGTPPHLHFGIYTPSGAINPLPLLDEPTESKVQNPPRSKVQRALQSKVQRPGSKVRNPVLSQGS